MKIREALEQDSLLFVVSILVSSLRSSLLDLMLKESKENWKAVIMEPVTSKG